MDSFEKSSDSNVDVGAFDQIASNLRPPTIDPEEYYDMSGEKILIILNQRKFMKTRYFNRKKPSCRDGTNEDRNNLKKLFELLGYKVIVMHNHQYHSIIQNLTAIAASTHTRTSCIIVAILTHGGPGGQICAADRPYLLSEVKNIFANVPSLLGKPKIYFVQACRGVNRDAGQTVHLGRQSNGVLAKLPSHMPSSRDLSEMDDDSSDRFDSQSDGVVIVPSNADSFVLYACAEGHISHRNSNGSWLIQAVCRQIQDLHKTKDIQAIMTKVIAEVARKTTSSKLEEKNNKKQIPETNCNLTKTFKF